MLCELDVLISGHQFKKLYEKKYEGIMKQYDLRKIEIEILNFISNCGDQDTARDIANLQYISKAHISNSIEDLTRKKIISVVEDCQDRRYIHLSLTEMAKPIVAEIEAVREEIFNILFDGIAQEEKEQIFNLAKKMVNNISEDLKNTTK